jgi:hypothetical protein
MRSNFTEDAANNGRPVSPAGNTAAHPVISVTVPAHNEEPGIASVLDAINATESGVIAKNLSAT